MSSETTVEIPTWLRDMATRCAFRAQPVFAQNGWTYGDAGVPSVGALEQTILHLIRSTLGRGEDGTTGTGRLYVSRHTDDGSVVWGVDLSLATAYEPDEPWSP